MSLFKRLSGNYNDQVVPNELISNTENESIIDYKDQLNKSLDACRKQRNMLVINDPESQIKEEIKDTKRKIIIQNQTRQYITDNINIEELSNPFQQKLGKLKIDRYDLQNPIHSLFRWMLLILYRTDPVYYTWPQFKNEVFKNDKGKDLKNRLGLMNLLSITKLESEKTKYLLNIQKQITDTLSSNKKIQYTIDQIFDVITIIDSQCESANKIKQLEIDLFNKQEEIRKHKEEIDKYNSIIQETKKSLRSLDSVE
ncbi:hypothetical protein pb186bvf_014049 [Paramecium bursaria]